MSYSYDDYRADLVNPAFPHLGTRERFSAFYHHLGADAVGVKYPSRMEWVRPRRGAKILELGCHAGYDLVHWLQSDPTCSVIGVDISHPLLTEASRRITAIGAMDRATLHIGFIEDLKPGDVPTDCTDIVLTEVLEHVIAPEPVIHSALSLLCGDADLWITVPSKLWGNSSHVRGITLNELREMVPAGFSFEEAWQDQQTHARIRVQAS